MPPGRRLFHVRQTAICPPLYARARHFAGADPGPPSGVTSAAGRPPRGKVSSQSRPGMRHPPTSRLHVRQSRGGGLAGLAVSLQGPSGHRRVRRLEGRNDVPQTESGLSATALPIERIGPSKGAVRSRAWIGSPPEGRWAGSAVTGPGRWAGAGMASGRPDPSLPKRKRGGRHATPGALREDRPSRRLCRTGWVVGRRQSQDRPPQDLRDGLRRELG
ncbi:hypothetical protein C8N38_110164 [Rhodovulum kholense]|uniref:Uncharacterized protein n=1 Tax=Rhodovulum kholense TaxID=453584 RepID=A0A8E2VK98_9RHOB|nr:hypothetical protein C8N38_110164 [Rhodovulum kholense]